jgi:hypothetical protein
MSHGGPASSSNAVWLWSMDALSSLQIDLPDQLACAFFAQAFLTDQAEQLIAFGAQSHLAQLPLNCEGQMPCLPCGAGVS